MEFFDPDAGAKAIRNENRTEMKGKRISEPRHLHGYILGLDTTRLFFFLSCRRVKGRKS